MARAGAAAALRKHAGLSIADSQLTTVHLHMPMGEAMQDSENGSGSRSVPPRASSTSSSLLERVRGNDAESWRRIVGLYAPLVLLWCRKRGLRDQDAQDVIQEVFTTVAVKIKGFAKDGRPGAFRRWLYTITSFKVGDNRRRAAREPAASGGSSAQARLAQVPVEDFEPDGEEEDVDHSKRYPSDMQRERGLLVRRALELLRDKFEPRTWDVVLSVVVEGRYVKDVAEEFGMKVGAVHKAKSVVLSSLRESLREYEEFLT
jgi:RNA polymerase sigma-70 factor (ECF subfamily)